MKKTFPILLLIILFSFNTKLFSQNEDYLKEVSFNFTYGVPVIEVNINGENYNFLFDTGMPATISENLNKKLKLSSTRNSIGSDVNGNKNNENYTILENIKIADINFNNTEVLVANLKSSFEIKCLQLDGVFGNNLMKNLIWEINYDTKKIRFTNNIEKLNISNNITKLNFKTKKGYYTPKVSVKINGKIRENLMFDTGSSAGINRPIEEHSHKKFKNSIEYYGSSKVALYGRAKKSKSIISKIDNIEIGSSKIKNQLVLFNKTTPLIGNKFLSNFKIIIDYNNNAIYLAQNENSNNIIIENFGFFANVIDDKMIVTTIFKNSIASQKINIGDEIISINSTPIPAILEGENPCGFLKKIFKDNDTNKFKIKHGKKILELNFIKKTLI